MDYFPSLQNLIGKNDVMEENCFHYKVEETFKKFCMLLTFSINGHKSSPLLSEEPWSVKTSILLLQQPRSLQDITALCYIFSH